MKEIQLRNTFIQEKIQFSPSYVIQLQQPPTSYKISMSCDIFKFFIYDKEKRKSKISQDEAKKRQNSFILVILYDFG